MKTTEEILRDLLKSIDEHLDWVDSEYEHKLVMFVRKK